MTARTLSAGAAVLALLAACAGGANKPPSAEETAALRIVVRDTSSAMPQTATLGCGDKAEGTGFLADREKAAAACNLVIGNTEAAKLLAQPAPADRMCTMVFGGPQVAQVTGTLRGRIIDRTFKRRNGCEIADWNSLVVLLGEPRGGPSGAPQ